MPAGGHAFIEAWGLSFGASCEEAAAEWEALARNGSRRLALDERATAIERERARREVMHDAAEASRTDESWDLIFNYLIEAGVLPFSAGIDDVMEAKRLGRLTVSVGIAKAALRPIPDEWLPHPSSDRCACNHRVAVQYD